MIHISSADALLFDLGRVVLDIDFDKALACWSGYAGCKPDDIAARFVRDEHYHQHERGLIEDAAYFQSLRNSLGIAITGVRGSVLVRDDGSGSISVRDVAGDFTVEDDGSGGISHTAVHGRVRVPSRD